ncbi:hypothetical protein EFY79_18725 [Hanamia caeni]|jgi:hypothetical protein|uniref:Uncharacterized protein n=1 Tax=Hanamia caeni TaxID=2294116 RepID=A0A3M9N6Q6_9BACT|nr:hypothetical protein [Hanamia caeni]RNI33480.1 hypothetical protein EFY79_18725 [Hanamia caeni]
MESIREIVIPENNKIELTIPDNFIGEQIEVFAIKIDKETDQFKRDKSFDAIKLDLSGFKFNREEANER